MKKIVVTGGAGFFASRFTEFYKNKYHIISLKRQDLDIIDEFKTIGIINDIKPDYVVHTAAIAETAKCENNPELSYNINVQGTMNVAKGCKKVGAKLIYLSSEQIFNGNNESGPYSEEVEPKPDTIYGKHKFQSEFKVQEILEEAWILRLTWMFGLPERGKKVNSNAVWNVISAAIKGEKIKVPSNEFRGMTYVYDLIENMEKIMAIPCGVYNTGSENNLSSYEIAVLVLKEMGIGDRIEELLIKDEEKFKNHPRDLRISNKKLRDNGVEFLSTEDGIRRCIREFNYGFK
jgi:dTDP-4-dehydrorhamnose reductase